MWVDATHVEMVVHAELFRQRLPSLIRQSELDPGVEAELEALTSILVKQEKTPKRGGVMYRCGKCW